MTNRVAFERGKRKPWKRTRPKGGMCFTVSWDRFEHLMRQDTDHYGQYLNGMKPVRYEVDEKGITVFHEPNIGEEEMAEGHHAYNPGLWKGTS